MSEFRLRDIPYNLQALLITTVITLGVVIILMTVAICGYHRWAINDVASQISEVQEHSMYSTVLVATILSTPVDQRAEMVQSVCPLEEQTAEEALCSTLLKMFKASSERDVVDGVKDINKTLEGGK